MSKRTSAALGAAVLTLGLGAFTGPAFAGGGNGNGNAAHGNSATAPGQMKNDASTATSSTAPTPASSKGSAKQNTPTSPGVKPTNTTLKNQSAAASSNRTKRYGNGTTAGQIATRAGYGNAMLYGPGNSQPHKYLCNGHYVDVHALKAHSTSCASTTPTQTGSQPSTPVKPHTPTPGSTPKTKQTPSTNHGSSVSGVAKGGTSAPSSGASSSPASGSPTSGGVLGATATKPASKGTGFGGVLGAVASVGRGTLPFTGFPLWVVALAGTLLLLGGMTVARRARATV